MAQKKNYFSGLVKIFLYLNIVFFLALAGSYFAPFINPQEFWFPAFLGLIASYLFLVNFLFIVIWLLLRKWFFLISLTGLLLGTPYFGKYYQLSGKEKNNEIEQQGIHILSFNVQNLLKQNISSTKHISDYSNRDKILSFIKNRNADIVFLQEFLLDDSEFSSILEEICQDLGYPYYVFSNYYDKDDKMEAILLLSKYPLDNFESKKYNKKNYLISAEADIKGRAVRLFNVHLASIGLVHEDYDFIQEMVPGSQPNKKSLSHTLIVFNKLKTAFQYRSRQVNEIKRLLDNSEKPVILAGDFNDTPFSYAYNQMNGLLNDAFTKSGQGFGETFSNDKLPSYRIDYIFYSDHFNSVNFTTFDQLELSDHHPISCNLISPND